MLQTCISKEDIHYVKDRSLEFLASGITSAIGEQCLTNAGALGVFPEPCLEAIAAGDGREIMKFDADIASMHGIRICRFPGIFVVCANFEREFAVCLV